ncbi:M23 family metallopeptidase [Patulibacter sp. SYSU D01012]|uniref:M23 family metallopeptidase n=1 Tax=Patulibacter sp. SYSU D01012 TaxID=2817381 RepID=UPI001B3122DD|nr:M23 family metallopeptidase [Patulibacter sp. SYSU D01012]
MPPVRVGTTGRIAARLRIPLCLLGVALVVVGAVAGVGAVLAAGLGLAVVGYALYLRVGTPHAPVTVLRPPVAGRWVALNSPADRVPSHGLHAYGQTYAIDLLHVPEGDFAPRLTWRPGRRPADASPGFGRPVLAPADGTVVRVRDGAPDHPSLASWPGLLRFYASSALRELGGPGRLMGNHVVLQLGDGVFAVLAHLQRGSVAVRPGDRVAAGDPIGACGSSGSSSEPHLHLQLMDRPRPLLAAGLPLTFAGLTDDDGAPVPLPAALQAVRA